uniref:DDE Tnp4 domain-containing protein n=1 Tax=Acanthochromis polyacanthus TaxID=80966 RepID=A0A3Q1FAT0_9TELE
ELSEHGEYHHLMPDLKKDPEKFRAYFHLSPELFSKLVTMVTPATEKIHTNRREPITSEERLAICLRFLATGDSFATIGFNYCYMPEPTMDDWKSIAEGFQARWNFPNSPPSSGSKYFTLVDANYMFRVIDVDGYGRNSDGGILSESLLGKRLRAGTLSLPEDTSLQGAEDLGPMPHVLVADEAFPLQRHIMRPYRGRHLQRKQKVYNYRLSRARRIVESTFGVLSTQWRMYRRVLGICPRKADSVVKATCVLQNYMRQNGEVERDAGLEPITQTGSNNSSREAASIREKYCDYFNSPAGEVPWQHQIL